MKIRTYSGYRLEIVPDNRDLPPKSLGDHKLMRSLMDSMAISIRRHVDRVGMVIVKWDTTETCSHCGNEWETLTGAEVAARVLLHDEESVEGEPMCCDSAIAEFRRERTASQ